jgi:lysophospholipase L1-like esterase
MRHFVIALLLIACDGGTAPADASGIDAAPELDAGMFDAGVLPGAGPRYVGRHVVEADGSVRFSWSGSGMVVRFRGTALRATLNGVAEYYTVVVDGEVQPRLAVSGGETQYTIASGLADAEHTVELYRRTEGFLGASVVRDVEVDGEMLAVPPPARSIEVIGDSNSTAYGVEGADAFCSFSADTQNAYLAYCAVAARAVGAELSTVAWSGKGVVNNYDMDTWEPLPELYDRVIADEDGPTGVIRPVDVVLINLGSNDFSTDGDPSGDVFTPAYVALLEAARAQHPNATILCTIAPPLSEDGAIATGYIQAAIAERNAAGDARVEWVELGDASVIDDLGCDSHPGDLTQAAIGANLVTVLERELGW